MFLAKAQEATTFYQCKQAYFILLAFSTHAREGYISCSVCLLTVDFEGHRITMVETSTNVENMMTFKLMCHFF